MINPINQINCQGYYIKPFVLKQKHTEQCDGLKLSGYSAGQAILARNNICFSGQEKIIPLSSVYNQPLKNNYTEFCYQYDSDKKNDNLAYYTGMLLMFLTPSFHSDTQKKTSNGKTYLSLTADTKPDGKSTTGDYYKNQQRLIRAVYDTPFDTTLNDIKQYDIELQEEEYKNGNLDIKARDENIAVIKSITINDVKDFMKNVLLDRNPYIATE